MYSRALGKVFLALLNNFFNSWWAWAGLVGLVLLIPTDKMTSVGISEGVMCGRIDLCSELMEAPL